MAHRPVIDNSAISARSKQNLSCNWTGSADFGRLVPIHWEELLPTDKVITFKPRIEMQMLNFASPTFSKIDLYVHAFVVPLRQIQKTFYDLWSRTGTYKDSVLQWWSPKTFNTQYHSLFEEEGYSRKAAAFKHWTSLGLNPFFTCGTEGQPSSFISDDATPIWLAPFFAYNKIWWDFYRDPELLRDESKDYYLYDGDIANNVPSLSSPDFANRYMLPHLRSIKNCWIADLFASGGQDFASISQMGNVPSPFKRSDTFEYNNLDMEDYVLYPLNQEVITPFAVPLDGAGVSPTSPLPNASAQLRLMEALTRLSERLSLSGKRQIEALFARYGVKPNWSKMNLCRYVGGGKTSVLVSDIISTADTGSNGLPLGAKGGSGYCALDSINLEFSVDEPSIFMVIASVMPHIHFVQGLSKKWQRKDLTDMFQDSLQYVGNVGIAKREVAMRYDNLGYNDEKDGEVFAYSDPYYEYRYGLDILAGDFMKYHDPQTQGVTEEEERQIHYMQSMENYIDFPLGRTFSYDNMLVDGDQFNKIFSYLGGSLWEAGDDHFHLCIDKEFIVDRPMEGFAVPTLETTQDPHQNKSKLSQDAML